VLDDLLATAQQGLASFAGIVDETVGRFTGERQPVGDPATPGSLERGPRPSASELRGATLQVPGEIDHARAQADAQRVLESIDFSKPEIALWVPATGSHSIPASWRRSVDAQFGGRASQALVDYPADFDFNDSVSTGMETLKLVLAGIAERGGHHRVTVAGHSQGAWVIGDAIDTPQLARMVDKAVIYGHPAPARVDWSRAGDPNVRQVDDPNDPFTTPLEGGRQALQAMDELQDGRSVDGQALDLGGILGRVSGLAKTAIANPRLSVYLLGKHVLPADREDGRDPHHYDAQYGVGARFLAA
jgi:hypothetical protein